MDESAALALVTARLLASASNPTLVVVMLAAPFFKSAPLPEAGQPVSRNEYLNWILFCLAAVAFPVVLAEMGKKREIRSGHPGFPSGHETFAAAAATCLVIRHPRLIVPALAIVLLMAWALVRAGYHEITDVLGASLLGPICAIAMRFAFRIRHEHRTRESA